jgi:NADPH:quinone reductase-like Zn-dependent oxidoreductase
MTAIVDLVGGKNWPALLTVLKRGGRYVTAGAIAGPIVELDLRTLYLKDLTLFGCAAQDDRVFENIVRYLNDGLLEPPVAQVFPLAEFKAAQELFLSKRFVGKIVVIP